MHKYMRAIGFSEYTDRKKLKELLTDVIMNSDHRAYTMNQEGILLGEFSKNHTHTKGTAESGTFGVAVCGEFDDNDKFIYEYYYPYLTGSGITSYEDVSVERHAEKDSYAGICDDIKVGISLIFYLRNRIPYIKAQSTGKLPIRGTTLTLSGLSLKGSILLPIKKDEEQVLRVKKDSANRNKLLAAARQGDEDAIETLTLEDMDMYTTISRRIQKDDIFSLVDTYFMPYGVECDRYSILGEILELHTIENEETREELYVMKLDVNELQFDVCVPVKEVLGEPAVGRRFKANMWLQGRINF